METIAPSQTVQPTPMSGVVILSEVELVPAANGIV